MAAGDSVASSAGVGGVSCFSVESSAAEAIGVSVQMYRPIRALGMSWRLLW